MAVFSVSLLLLFAGCGVIKQVPDQPNTITVSVDLSSAKKQAQAMADAANQWAQQAAGTLSAAGQGNLQKALVVMNGAVSAFVGLPDGQSPTAAQYAEAASKAIMAVIPLLPIPAVAKIAFEAGLGVIEAFAAGMSAITVPASNPPAALRHGHPTMLRAPVPIPVP